MAQALSCFSAKQVFETQKQAAQSAASGICDLQTGDEAQYCTVVGVSHPPLARCFWVPPVYDVER
jgi:hypothetical protein